MYYHSSCNSNAKPPATIKILLIGNDWLQGTTLRHYVDLLGVRPPDWVSHLRFYEVPIGTCTMSKYLASIDQSYQAMFGTENWSQLCERAAACINSMDNKSDVVEMCNRIQRYLHTAGPCTQIPIAEAMVNYKDEDSCQIFVPFISVSSFCDVLLVRFSLHSFQFNRMFVLVILMGHRFPWILMRTIQ